jgi:hypothetical protein
MREVIEVKSERGWPYKLVAFVMGFWAFLAWPGPVDAAAVSLAWNPNGEPDLAGYKVYVGTLPGIYTQTFDVLRVTTYTVSNLAGGQTYYFAVTAYDVFANESRPSHQPEKAEVRRSPRRLRQRPR